MSFSAEILMDKASADIERWWKRRASPVAQEE